MQNTHQIFTIIWGFIGIVISSVGIILFLNQETTLLTI